MIDPETFAEILVADSLQRAVAQYGIEGTEQKIKELYKLMPVCQEKMLAVLYKIYYGRKKV